MERISIDLIPGGYKPTCHASQFDDGRVIRFDLFNRRVPYTLTSGESVEIKITKPNGSERTEYIANTQSSYVDWTTVKETCDVAGDYSCELVVSKDGKDIGSGNFTLAVEIDPYGDSTITVQTASGAIATFTTNIVDLLQEVKCEINASGGNGTPDNPNPIEGFTEAKIKRCGVNLFDKDNANVVDGYISATAFSDSNTKAKTIYIPIAPNTTYTVSKTAGVRFAVAVSNVIPTNGATYTTRQQDNTASSITITASATDRYLWAWVFLEDSDTGTPAEMLSSVQIEKGSTATAYSPYTGDTYTAVFGQTIYGGVLDVTRGKLTVTHGFVEYDGSNDESWALYSGQRFVVAVSDFTSPTNSVVANIKCNRLATISKSSQGSTTGVISGSDEGYHQFMVNVGQSTVEDMRTWLGNNPLQVAYELATPFDIDLTPVQIEALLGINNVWHDGNGNTEVKYLTLNE